MILISLAASEVELVNAVEAWDLFDGLIKNSMMKWCIIAGYFNGIISKYSDKLGVLAG